MTMGKKRTKEELNIDKKGNRVKNTIKTKQFFYGIVSQDLWGLQMIIVERANVPCRPLID